MSRSLNEMTDEERWQLFPVILSEYDPIWKERYSEEEKLLKRVVGDSIVRIRHFGSTSVPGLKAKPTIDILMEIHEDTGTKQLINAIEKQGYIYSHQPDNPPPHILFYKGYTPDGFKGQAFHLHVRYYADWDEIYFRDYLTAHPQIALEYAQLKTELALEYEHNRDAYTEAKTDFIKRITGIAREESLH